MRLAPLSLVFSVALAAEPECKPAPVFDTASTSDAVRHYEAEGYAILRNVLDPSLMHEVARHVEHVMARYPTVPPEHLHHIFMKNDAFWIRLASDPRLLDVATSFAPFIDGPIALFSSHYFCKAPRAGKRVLWHQDGSYWPLRPMNVITLYLAVDQADQANGGMRIIPGSQLWDLSELHNSTRDGSDVLGSATHTDESLSEHVALSMDLHPGDVEIHHPNLVHESPPNHSDRRRCALTLRYISPSTECWDAEQPVMMMRGEAVPGVNRYYSWPAYRHGYDMPFEGADVWNATRRLGTPESEALFARTDWDKIDAELEAEVERFINSLGGRAEHEAHEKP